MRIYQYKCKIGFLLELVAWTLLHVTWSSYGWRQFLDLNRIFVIIVLNIWLKLNLMVYMNIYLSSS